MSKVAATGLSTHALVGQSPVIVQLKEAMTLRSSELNQMLDVIPKVDPRTHHIIDVSV